MSAPNDRDPVDEAALAALFDRTSNAPSVEQRTRLTARAERIAEQRRPRRVASVVWPAALAAAAGVVYLAVAPPHPTSVATPAPSATEHPSASAVVGNAPPPVVPVTNAGGEAEPEDPVATVLGGEPEDWDPLDLAPLMRGEADESAIRKGH